MFDDIGSKKINSFIDEISNKIKHDKDASMSSKIFFSESISQFRIIIKKMLKLSNVNSIEKLKDLILLQTFYSIKVLNVNSEISFAAFDPATSIYYDTAYAALKEYYFDLFDECKKQKFIKYDFENEIVFDTIQNMILHRYLFYYKNGEISSMLDYMDETFELFLNGKIAQQKLYPIKI
jgi:hypothetical protein